MILSLALAVLLSQAKPVKVEIIRGTHAKKKTTPANETPLLVVTPAPPPACAVEKEQAQLLEAKIDRLKEEARAAEERKDAEREREEKAQASKQNAAATLGRQNAAAFQEAANALSGE